MDLEDIIVECDKEMAEYWVHSGQQVSMGVHGKFIVSSIILGKEIEQCFLPKNVWKLFTLIHIGSGINWFLPVPVMSDGAVDLRKIVGVGDAQRMQTLTYESGVGTGTRVYKAVEVDGSICMIRVKDR